MDINTNFIMNTDVNFNINIRFNMSKPADVRDNIFITNLTIILNTNTCSSAKFNMATNFNMSTPGYVRGEDFFSARVGDVHSAGGAFYDVRVDDCHCLRLSREVLFFLISVHHSLPQQIITPTH